MTSRNLAHHRPAARRLARAKANAANRAMRPHPDDREDLEAKLLLTFFPRAREFESPSRFRSFRSGPIRELDSNIQAASSTPTSTTRRNSCRTAMMHGAAADADHGRSVRLRGEVLDRWQEHLERAGEDGHRTDASGRREDHIRFPGWPGLREAGDATAAVRGLWPGQRCRHHGQWAGADDRDALASTCLLTAIGTTAIGPSLCESWCDSRSIRATAGWVDRSTS